MYRSRSIAHAAARPERSPPELVRRWTMRHVERHCSSPRSARRISEKENIRNGACARGSGAVDPVDGRSSRARDRWRPSTSPRRVRAVCRALARAQAQTARGLGGKHRPGRSADRRLRARAQQPGCIDAPSVRASLRPGRDRLATEEPRPAGLRRRPRPCLQAVRRLQDLATSRCPDRKWFTCPYPKDGEGRVEEGRRSQEDRGVSAGRIASAELEAMHPVHVVLRRTVGYRGATRAVLRPRAAGACSASSRQCDDFASATSRSRSAHLHLIVEAVDRKALSRGMKSFATPARARDQTRWWLVRQGFSIATTRRRWTARHARHALAYVLNNWRRHREDFANGRMLTRESRRVLERARLRRLDDDVLRCPRDYEPLPVSPPETSLLRRRWRRYGLY